MASISSRRDFLAASLAANARVASPSTWRCVWLDSQGEIARAYIHNGDPNVVVRLPDNSLASIIWDKVEQWDIVEIE